MFTKIININLGVLYKKTFQLKINKLDTLACGIAFVITLGYLLSNNFIFNNIFAISFTVVGIQVILFNIKILKKYFNIIILY